VHDDIDYESLRRRSRRLAAFYLAAGLVLGMVVLRVPHRPSALVARDAMVPATVIPATPIAGCTKADLTAPSRRTMPLPQVVVEPLIVHPAPDIQRLSPPDLLPRVSAAQAWSVMGRNGWPDPTTAGPAQVLLGDLYAATPATIWADQTSHPIYTHTLVWAIYAAHQPEPPTVPPQAADPPCYFESTVFYVDAVTGRPLEAELFAPPASSTPPL
jgi:hypothetical protein